MFAYGTFAEITFAQEPRAEAEPEPAAPIFADSRFVPTYEYVPRKRKKRKTDAEERAERELALRVAMDGPMADPVYAAKVRAQEEDDALLIAAFM